MKLGIIPNDILIAFLLAFVVGMVFFPLFIRWQQQRHLGQKIKKEGPNLHLHKENTPSMGGIVIFIALFSKSLFVIGFEEGESQVLFQISTFLIYNECIS